MTASAAKVFDQIVCILNECRNRGMTLAELHDLLDELSVECQSRMTNIRNAHLGAIEREIERLEVLKEADTKAIIKHVERFT